MTGPARPFHFVVALWGAEFRQLFLDLCLPSLLAPGNLPVLAGRGEDRFHIYTTDEDADEIRRHPGYAALTAILPCEIEIIDPAAERNKYRLMSQAHLRGARHAFASRAYGVFICPDAMFSDGAVAALARHAERGAAVVLAPAIRFAREPVVAELHADGRLGDGRPLVRSARDLAGIGLRMLHHETLGWEWQATDFAQFPISCFWRVPDGSGVVLHTFSWAPLLIDYGSIAEHDTKALETWTMDGDYIFRNFGEDDARIHVVTDSDELFYLSVTPVGDRAQRRPRNLMKSASLRLVAYSPIMDALKRRLFRRTVRLHSGEIGAAWSETERKASAILDSAIRRPGRVETFVHRYLGEGAGGVLRHMRDWLRHRFGTGTA